MSCVTQLAKFYSYDVLKKDNKNISHSRFYFEIRGEEYQFIKNELETFKKVVSDVLFAWSLSFEYGFENSSFIVKGKKNNVPEYSIPQEIIHEMRKLNTITPVIHCTVGSDVFPKVKAAQIGGPDIDMEYVVDKDGNVRYLKSNR